MNRGARPLSGRQQRHRGSVTRQVEEYFKSHPDAMMTYSDGAVYFKCTKNAFRMAVDRLSEAGLMSTTPVMAHRIDKAITLI